MLSHVSPSDLILAAFVIGCTLTVLLADWNSRHRRDDENDDGEGPLADVMLP